MKLKAFVDDSSRDDRIFVLGGHIASSDTWSAFSNEWAQFLPSLGSLSKGGQRRFKMSEIPITRDGIWRAKAFYKIIDKYDICSISSCVDKKEVDQVYNDLWHPGPSMNISEISDYGKSKNIFLILFRLLMEGVHNNRDILKSVIPPAEPIDFIFDQQIEEKFVVEGWDQYVANRPISIKKLFGSLPRFERDEEFPPLQAADLWAWWIREKTFPSPRTDNERGLIREMHELMESSPRQILHINMRLEDIAQVAMASAKRYFQRSREYKINYRFTQV